MSITTTVSVPRSEIVSIAKTAGFFTVTFIKKDGSTRVMNGRMGVAKHTIGGVRTSDPSEYLMVWETGHESGRDGYRNVNISTIKSLVANNTTYVPA